MSEEIKVSKMRKRNMKLFPIYETIGLDYIFFYGIKVLFLSQVKEISDSNIILLSSMYALFAIFMQIPICGIVNKIGKRKSLIYGNLLKAISIIIIIVFKDFVWMILSQFTMAAGFSLTGVSANPILTESIPKSTKRGSIFSKIYGKGYSRYCYLCALSTAISGYLYTINPYIPMWLCVCATLFSIIISYNFIEIEEFTTKEKKRITIEENVKNIMDGFKKVIKSERLKSLLLTTGIMWGLFCLLSTYQTTLLKNMNVSASYIGIIAAIVQLLTGIYSKRANEYNRKNTNKSLTKMSLGITIGAIIIGLTTIAKIPLIIQLIIITFMFCERHRYKGYFQVLRFSYMGNFASDKMITKIYACNSMTANIMRAIIEYIGSIILLYMNIQYATLTIGISFTIICLIMSLYMKSRLGIMPKHSNNK